MTAQEKPATRHKLIETAIELIWRHSYGSVSVDDICRHAGVNKGSFYHYFKSKADLSVAALETHYEEMRPLYDMAFSPSLPPLERLENLVQQIVGKQRRVYDLYGQVCGCPFASLGSEMAGQDNIIRDKVNEIFASYDLYLISLLRDLVAEGVVSAERDPGALVSELRSYIMGVVMMARIQNSLDGMEKDLREGLMRIVGVEGSPRFS